MHFIPNWLFEQDYLVFLSFFGWMLIGLLSWTQPLSDREGKDAPWLWFGYFGFSQAIAEFFKVLSFSDPFFRLFNFGSAFEMLGFGVLIDVGLRSLPRFKGRSVPPFASIACCLLGFALQVDPQPFTQFVAFCLAVFGTGWACRLFLESAKKRGRRELYFIVIGLFAALAAWVVDPQRLALLSQSDEVQYGDYPYYGFLLLAIRVLAGWTILFGFWSYRLEMRIVEVQPQIAEQLRFWGFKVLPSALGVIVAASYLITTWTGRKEQESMKQDYLFRAQTAALAMDAEFTGLRDRRFQDNLTKQLLAIEKIGTDVLMVYLWQGDAEGVQTATFGNGDKRTPVIRSTFKSLRRNKEFLGQEAIMMGPIVLGAGSALNVSAPVMDVSGMEPSYWLGIDLSAGSWMKNISMARLQTIIIAGLLMALVIFFLYYQVVHESEADLALAKERAEAGDRAKSEFLAVISHEIRTPLQSVLGYSALLRGTALNEKQLSCLDTIQSEGRMLLRIVQDILDFSNLRKASFELREDTVQLRNLINETYRTIQPMGEKKGLKAELRLDEGVPDVVRADGVRLRQVLLNLFGNSVKYTEEGSVLMEVKLREETSEAGGRVGIDFVISDTGIGIRKEDLARLFEPFIQLEHTSHFGREGAGLGLAIVSRIAELMGGETTVESELGKGSVFAARFEFAVLDSDEGGPTHAGDYSQEAVVNLDTMGEQYPLRVLVADDNPMIRNLIAQYLDTLGYKPDVVDGGRPAAEKGASYDLVVIDLRMPDIDGPKAATMIREASGVEDVPWIIGVSATLAESEIQHALSSGINEFLGKPFFAESLAEKISAIPWIEEVNQWEDGVKPVSKESVSNEPVAAVPAVEEAPELPASITGGGMGFFSEEMVDAALIEVTDLHDQMIKAEGEGDYIFVREKAHYLSNTAMAIGIDSLFLDSKALQKAADEERVEEVRRLLPLLKENFLKWRAER